VSAVDIVHYVGATTNSRSVVASLAADHIERKDSVRVLDISAWSTISQDLPPSWVVRLLGGRIYPGAFDTTLSELGISLLRLEPSLTPNRSLPESDHKDLLQALESELLTYFRRDQVPETWTARALSASLTKNAEKTYWALDQLWSHGPPHTVLIPNGRTSRQKAARLVAAKRGIKVLLYEAGRAKPNSYYLGTTQPHDRLASQEEVGPLTEGLSATEVSTIAQEWLLSRMGITQGTNQFSSRWEKSELQRTPEKKAVFFASSFDEFLAFGPMWNIDRWSHQFEAFDEIMTILEQSQYSLVLRLHPNLGSKSTQYFKNEVTRVRELMANHPGLHVFWHNSPVNSYDLVASADMVIVERSTIGLEANLLGKPVWVTQASQWDQCIDIRQVLSPEELTTEILKPWTPDVAKAERFVAYWMIQEYPLRFDWSNWSSWDPEKPPFRLKFARLALKNPWFHRWNLIYLEWSRWRNGRFRPPQRIQEKE